jgi:DNA repair exonuclease SbcCD ATPase subunit
MLTQQQKATLEELSSDRAELLRSQNEINRKKSELASLKAALSAIETQPVTDIECESYASSDFILQKLHGAINSRKLAPEPKNTEESDRLEKEYAVRIEQIRNEIRRKNKADIEREIKKTEAAINSASEQQSVIQEEVRRLRRESDRFGMSSIDMQMRREEIKHRQKSLDEIATELERLRVEANAAPRVISMGPAEASEE